MTRAFLVAALVYALSFSVMSLAFGSRVSIRSKRDKGIATITVMLDPRAADRHLYVSAASENVYESTYRQLDGERSRAQWRFEWRLPDDGEYVIEARVGDASGATVAQAQAILFTLSKR